MIPNPIPHCNLSQLEPFQQPVIARPTWYWIFSTDSINSCKETPNYLMKLLESIQYQAALAVSGAWKGTNRDKIYDELGWESLTKAVWRLVQFYIIIKGPTPEYLRIPTLSLHRHLCGICSNNVLKDVVCKTDRGHSKSKVCHCMSLFFLAPLFPHVTPQIVKNLWEHNKKRDCIIMSQIISINFCRINFCEANFIKFRTFCGTNLHN